MIGVAGNERLAVTVSESDVSPRHREKTKLVTNAPVVVRYARNVANTGQFSGPSSEGSSEPGPTAGRSTVR